METEGFDGLITQDRQQLRNDDERRRLIDSSIHWIGRKHNRLKGMKQVAAASATYLAAFPQILGELEQAIVPMLFIVKNIPVGTNQRVKSRPIDY